ncbi:MAG: hypothetical protein K2N58_11100 [Treponemataceae bacterium]|nr:hypothetical protein [Treponemataceae bacterium]
MEIQYIGIGKIILNSQDTETYNIPHMHCLLTKTDELIEAVNLEFGICAAGNDSSLAIKNLVEMLIEYIKRTITEFGFDNLIAVACKGDMNDMWNEYRQIEFTLAKNKQDLGHTVVDVIKKSAYKEFIQKYGIETKASISFIEGKAA